MPNTQQNSLSELIRSINIDVSGSSAFRRFQRMYARDRTAFVYDCMPTLAKTFTFYQFEILGYFDEGYTRVAVRGPHGLGKTTLASVLTHHSVLTAEADCKVPTTASAWRQLEKYLWPEIKKTAKWIDWTRVNRDPYTQNELMSLSLKLSHGLVEAFAIASDDHNTIEGAHATRLIYIFDEAKAIPRQTWNAAEGAFSTNGLSVMKAVQEPAVDPVVYSDRIKVPVVQESVEIDYDVPDSEKPYSSNESAIGDRIEGEDEVATGLMYRERFLGKKSVHMPGWVAPADMSAMSQRNTNGADNSGNSELGADNLPLHPNNLPLHPNNLPPGNSPPLPLHPASTSSVPEQNRSTSANIRVPRICSVDRTPVTADPISRSSTVIVAASLRSRSKIKSKPSATEQSSANTVNECLAFAISTPGDPTGQFYDICMQKPGYEDWKVRHVTLEEAVRAGRISADWAEQRKKQWGENSSLYLNRVLGEFSDNSEDGIIPLSWIRLACERWKDWASHGRPSHGGKKTMGVDTARFGEDKTVLALRLALTLQDLLVFSKLPVTSTAGQVMRYAEDRHIHIETDGGLGAAVYDILKEDGMKRLVPIIVNGGTYFRDRSNTLRFYNVRSAMWWHMREILDPAYDSEVMLPPVEALILDLSTPRYSVGREAVVKVESKDEIKKRLGRSPDYGDACCLAFWDGSKGGGGIVF